MTSEFSRLFALSDASSVTRHVALEASEAQCAALAARFGVLSIKSCTADVAIAPHSSGYHITGYIKGAVEQGCGVTGAPVVGPVEKPLNTLLWTGEIEGDLDMLEEAYQVEEIEPIEGDEFDLGELCAQHFGVAIDPFPRAEGVSFDANVPQKKTNPFSVLAQLKDKA